MDKKESKKPEKPIKVDVRTLRNEFICCGGVWDHKWFCKHNTKPPYYDGERFDY
jgi:hypothetical protein